MVQLKCYWTSIYVHNKTHYNYILQLVVSLLQQTHSSTTQGLTSNDGTKVIYKTIPIQLTHVKHTQTNEEDMWTMLLITELESHLDGFTSQPMTSVHATIYGRNCISHIGWPSTVRRPRNLSDKILLSRFSQYWDPTWVQHWYL